MDGLAWIMTFSLGIIYFTALLTVCVLTFRKGYTVLGIVGIFMPLLWLIGAILPAKPGSPYDLDQSSRYLPPGQESAH